MDDGDRWLGDLQIDSDSRVSKLAATKGIALMPLLTNLVGDTWQPEAIENLAHGPANRQDRFIARMCFRFCAMQRPPA